MDTVTQVEILDEVICLLCSVNYLWKRYASNKSPWLGRLDSLILVWQLGEGKLIQTH